MELTNILIDVESCIDQELSNLCCACWVYGSVAQNNRTQSSDLDCMIIYDGKISSESINRLRQCFMDLQYKHQFAPDLAFPVELFTVVEVTSMLVSSSYQEKLREAWQFGVFNPLQNQDDTTELFRALLSSKIIVRGSSFVFNLESSAWNALEQGSPLESKRADLLKLFDKTFNLKNVTNHIFKN